MDSLEMLLRQEAIVETHLANIREMIAEERGRLAADRARNPGDYQPDDEAMFGMGA